jgi:16S rRNA (cytidine1402-2'-O)-methyltransferase
VARHTPNAREHKSVPGEGEPTGAPGASKRHATLEDGGGENVAILAAGLHLVATPIGNLGDMSPRALEVLGTADLVACEDTRVTGSLLAKLGVNRSERAPLVPYHEHNAEEMRPRLMARMQAGAAVALVSDAGTPAISDPGYKLVRACIEAGIAVTGVPGANAALLGLVLSGLPTDRFLFNGFLPAKAGARKTVLQKIAAVPASLIFYESGPRLAASLADMAEVLGNREACVARELTKLFEEVRRGTLDELTAAYAAGGGPKGEIVVIVAPPAEDAASAESIEDMLVKALATMSVRDAADAVAKASGRPKREVYTLALSLSERP